MAGINEIEIRPSAGAKWSMGHSSGKLMIHPKTAEHIANSPVQERATGGIDRVLHHEAGHGMWNYAPKDQKEAFTKAVGENPDLVERIGKIVNLNLPKDSFNDSPTDAKERVVNEVHSEVQAMRKYNPEKYNALPDSIKGPAETIRSHAKQISARPKFPSGIKFQ